MRDLPIRWVVGARPDSTVAGNLASTLRIPSVLAGLLVQRGYLEPELAKGFLRPELSQLSDPFRLAGMAEAVELVIGALSAGRKILVHGDYDVDGQCASAMLVRALRELGGDAEGFVPHRMTDGYDFGSAGLEHARAIGASLIVTCDCGTTALEAVSRARAEGFEVIVTDHHLLGATWPNANAIINPQRPDDRSGLAGLCGTGIVFKLVQALAASLGRPESFALHFLDFAALATVADVVPLIGENRVIVRHGLKLLARSRWAGLRALIQVAGLENVELRSSHLGFALGPRLNAAGRIGDAKLGLRLLTTDSWEEASQLALTLEQMNNERQTLDQDILDEAIETIATQVDLTRTAGLVLASDQWHPGVIGIVASRVVERFGRPTFLVGFDGGMGKGSGRSISSFDLHQALTQCGDLLERYGGHRMAAGLTIRRERFEEFRGRFAEVCAERLNPEALGPEQRVDLEIGLAEATDELERLCRHLEPCGMGNPGPVFLIRDAQFANWSFVGAKREHVKGLLRDHRGQVPAIGFQMADRAERIGELRVDAAFRLERHEFRGQRYLQARLVGLTPSSNEASQTHPFQAA